MRSRLGKALSLLAVGGGLALACAEGDPVPTETVVPVEGGAPAADACAGVTCAGGQVCSAGACVSPDWDGDGDGYPASKDCDDTDPNIHPGAAEVCNGKDDNCDGKVDEGFDKDGDGYVSCDTPGKPKDCDDNDPEIHPGAVEICNNKDDNCDGRVDEGFDKDNDGYYTCAHPPVAADCDDNDATVNPGAKEVCNGKDDNCSGKADDIPAQLAGSLLAPINSHWVTGGAATVESGWAKLTPDATNAAGGLWWNASYVFDSFDMTAIFWIQNKADGADGMTFSWVPTGTPVNSVGAAGAGYGVIGLYGWSVVIDTYQNADIGEPAAPFLAVQNNVTGQHVLRRTIPNVRDAANHQLRVKLAASKLSVWIDGVNYVFDQPLPAYVAYAGRWGFTAGTGGLSSSHYVQNVVMTFPEGQGCVP